MKIKLLGSNLTKTPRAVDGAFAPAREYHLAPVYLLKVGCPREISAAAENTHTGSPIVIEKNRKAFGTVKATGYAPAAVVVAGGNTRATLLADGELTTLAWVEAGLSIQADDAISCQELMNKLQTEITQRIYGDRGPGTGQSYPYILFCYPFESYFIFDLGGQKYRESYSIDPIKRNVKLSGQPVKVKEQFVNAQSEFVIQADGGMPRAQTGVRNVINPLGLTYSQVSWRGGSQSELVTQVIRNFTNINQAVTNLTHAIRYGLYTRSVPDFSPVALSTMHKLVAPFIKAGIAPVDVVTWAGRKELLQGVGA